MLFRNVDGKKEVNNESAPTCDDGQDGAEKRRFLELHRSRARTCLGGVCFFAGIDNRNRVPGCARASTPRSARADRRNHDGVCTIRPIHRADPLSRHCRGYAAATGAALLGQLGRRGTILSSLADHFLSARWRRPVAGANRDEKSCLSYRARHTSQRETRVSLAGKLAPRPLRSFRFQKQGRIGTAPRQYAFLFAGSRKVASLRADLETHNFV